MSKPRNLLWRLFGATMAFCCHTMIAVAVCDYSVATWQSDPKFSLFAATGDTTYTICDDGYYLYSCGTAVLGTRWLENMVKTINGTTVCTPSFYSADGQYANMENLRTFFSNGSTLIGNPNTSVGSYEEYRNIILSLACTNDNGKLSNIQCKKCPNDAVVPPSTVTKNGTDDKILPDTWNVHTIADCYIGEFSDNTGTYVYTPTNIENNNAINCYFSSEVVGIKPVLE